MENWANCPNIIGTGWSWSAWASESRPCSFCRDILPATKHLPLSNYVENMYEIRSGSWWLLAYDGWTMTTLGEHLIEAFCVKKHLFQISMSFITYLVVFQYLFCPELVFQDEKRRCSLNMPSMESAGQFNIPPGSSCCSKVPISALLIFQVKVITWGPTLQKPTSKVGTLGFFRNQCADW